MQIHTPEKSHPAMMGMCCSMWYQYLLHPALLAWQACSNPVVNMLLQKHHGRGSPQKLASTFLASHCPAKYIRSPIVPVTSEGTGCPHSSPNNPHTHLRLAFLYL